MLTVACTITPADLHVFNMRVTSRVIKNLVIILAVVTVSLNFFFFLQNGDIGAALLSSIVALIGFALILFAVRSLYPYRFAAITVVAVITLSLLLFANGTPILSSLLVFTPVIFAGFVGVILRVYLENIYRMKNDSIGDRTLSLDDKGVYEKTQNSESSQKWDLVSSIEQDDHYIYLFLGRTKAHVVPKRSFSTSEEIENFVKFAVESRGRSVKTTQ